MKNKGDFQISVEDHFKALGLNDEQRKAALSILADAEAIVDENGEKQISVRAYTDYILFRLDELASSAKELQSLDDLKNYESLTRGFMHEWAIIIGNLSHHLATEHRFESVDESVKTLENFIGQMRDIFEHLVNANKSFIEFGRAFKDRPNQRETNGKK